MADPDKFTMKNVDPDMVQKNTMRAAKFYFDSMKKNNIDIDDVDLYITTQMGKYKIPAGRYTEDTSREDSRPVRQVRKYCSGIDAHSPYKSSGKR